MGELQIDTWVPSYFLNFFLASKDKQTNTLSLILNLFLDFN